MLGESDSASFLLRCEYERLNKAFEYKMHTFEEEEVELLSKKRAHLDDAFCLRRSHHVALLALNGALFVGVILSSLFLPVWRCKTARLSDLKDAQSAIQYETRNFTGALSYDAQSKKMIRLQDADMQYFGRPSLDIDRAWDDLLHGEFPVLTDQEAVPFEPELKRVPHTGHFHFEPDVFHSLHCLNAVRKYFSPFLYVNSTSGSFHQDVFSREEEIVHLEHCLDRIRQSIMCHGDLTPSPLYSWQGWNVLLGKSGAHTCRQWASIRDWMDERGRQGPTL